MGGPDAACEGNQDAASVQAPLVLYGPFAALLDVAAGPSPPAVPPYSAAGPGREIDGRFGHEVPLPGPTTVELDGGRVWSSRRREEIVIGPWSSSETGRISIG